MSAGRRLGPRMGRGAGCAICAAKSGHGCAFSGGGLPGSGGGPDAMIATAWSPALRICCTIVSTPSPRCPMTDAPTPRDVIVQSARTFEHELFDYAPDLADAILSALTAAGYVVVPIKDKKQ